MADRYSEPSRESAEYHRKSSACFATQRDESPRGLEHSTVPNLREVRALPSSRCTSGPGDSPGFPVESRAGTESREIPTVDLRSGLPSIRSAESAVDHRPAAAFLQITSPEYRPSRRIDTRRRIAEIPSGLTLLPRRPGRGGRKDLARALSVPRVSWQY